ncbi:FkbM family methyltransferase [Acetobacter fallax]|uniref:FkbM family methyltransferase n=1 Tax=Acetobacter fallax TaxID=1737473 RepID=A0ABX0KD05_9PROT|nr:FkbM family methyltransferase [Acetobacter fallax]NHO34021.1 FkbM family methyltransferase [Acetobacter fallax]NHO37555.1 FkbM family methyltransferase [Acetobacter fallax]
MKMISYAQNFEDILLWRCLKEISNGFYVDVGAHHPEIDSITKWFYDQGWTGINIEPVPFLFHEIKKHRPRDTNLNIAAGAAEGQTDLYVFPDSPGLSTISKEIARKTDRKEEIIRTDIRPLRDILAAFKGRDIHFLKIDVEGAERDVLSGMDFTRFRPWILVIEAIPADGNGGRGLQWDDLVLASGYQEVWFDGLNRYFVSDEHQDLSARLAIPPNVFDNFEQNTTFMFRYERDLAERSLHEAQTVICDRDDGVRERDTMIMALKSEISHIEEKLNKSKDTEHERDEAEKALREAQSIICSGDDVIRERDTMIVALKSEISQIEEKSNKMENQEKHSQEIIERKNYEILILSKENDRINKELNFLKDVQSIAEANRYTFRDEIQKVQEKIRKANEETIVAQAEVQEARRWLDAYRQSTSWRCTAPVRLAGLMAKKLVKKNTS